MTPSQTHNIPLPPKRPLSFFIWLLGLSIPAYLLGIYAPGLRQHMPLGLPISALMFCLPALLAVVFRLQEAGKNGVLELLLRIISPLKCNTLHWVFAPLVIVPAVAVLAWGLNGLLLVGESTYALRPGLLLLAFFVYIFGALGEELGWMGYAIGPLQARLGFWGAGLLLGFVWWVWHLIPYASMGYGLNWIVWQGVATIASRVAMVAIYNRSAPCILSAIFFHTMINVCTYPDPSAVHAPAPPVAYSLVMVLASLILGSFHVRHAPAASQTRSKDGSGD